MASKIQFFIGKGGVGKSTTAALTALSTAQAGRDTRLISLDPAHNQRDIFQQPFTEKPRQVSPHLQVMEVDSERWIRTYLQETQTQIKKSYRYHSAFNLENCFNILQFAPGLEEYALLLAFQSIIHHADADEQLIFDMAPTALTLKFFSLPSVSLIWLEELLKLRTYIYEKKEISSRILLGPKVIEQDKVKTKLTAMIHDFQQLNARFQAPDTQINLVLNPEPLAIAEARRIRTKLRGLGLGVARLILNKTVSAAQRQEIGPELDDLPLQDFPLSAVGLRGLAQLKRYIMKFPPAPLFDGGLGGFPTAPPSL